MPHRPPMPRPAAWLAWLGLALWALASLAAHPAWALDEAFIGAQGQAEADGGQPTPPAQPAPQVREMAASPAQELLDQGELAAAAGHFEEARRLWNKALALRPGWAVAQRRLAELPQRQAAFPGDQASQERRRQARLAMVQGVTYFNAQRYQEARDQFRDFLEVFPEDAEGLRYLGLAEQQLALVQGGRLLVNSQPLAQVYLDGAPRGRTPLTLERVPAGPHSVEVRAHGQSQSQQVSLRGRSTVEVSFTLLGGQLSVNCQPWAQVYLDGRLVGQTPLTLENLVLGPHQLSLRRPGYQDQEAEVVLERGNAPSLSFTLTPR